MGSPARPLCDVAAPVWGVDWRGPLGPALARLDGSVGRWRIEVTVTAAEIHLRLSDAGDAWAIDLEALCLATARAVAAAMDAAGTARRAHQSRAPEGDCKMSRPPPPPPGEIAARALWVQARLDALPRFYMASDGWAEGQDRRERYRAAIHRLKSDLEKLPAWPARIAEGPPVRLAMMGIAVSSTQGLASACAGWIVRARARTGEA